MTKFGFHAAVQEDIMVVQSATAMGAPTAVVSSVQNYAENMFTNKYAEGVIATVPTGEACGYALFSMSFSPWYGLPVMNIIDVFCSPQVAANSLDRQLFSALCTVASERKCCRLEWRVNKSNQEQIQLAEKIGAMPLEGSELVMIEGEENITQLARLTDQPLPGWK